MSRKWTIGLAAEGHTYLVTALYMEDDETYSVMLKVDGEYKKTLPSDDPATLALKLIADAELGNDDTDLGQFVKELQGIEDSEKAPVFQIGKRQGG